MLYRRVGKRLFDLVLVIPSLILLSPIFLLLWVLVKTKLGSPALFKQIRPGRDEKTFTMLKFRTMTDGRDKDGNLLSDTERLTGFGRKLRSTSLDELPELINVLKGDMSLVGPRPLLTRYTPYFTDAERVRFSVRPGITGLAQVSGRNDLAWDKRIATDVEYVEKLSWGLDLKIIFSTLGKIFKRSGVREDPGAVMLDFDVERKLKAEGKFDKAEIEPASLEDAEDIFAIKHEGMPAAYLQYTIYRSPKSVSFLRKQLEDPKTLCRVLRKNGRVIGYSQSTINDDAVHLGFITLSPNQQGRGYGNLLLDDLVEQCKRLGKNKITLDVFEDNEVATAWYMKRGFKSTDSSTVSVLNMDAVYPNGSAPKWSRDALQEAIKQEEQQGFGNIEVEDDSHPIQLGIIAGDTVRLRKCDSGRQKESVEAASVIFKGSRSRMVVTAPTQDLPEDWFAERHILTRMELDL